MVDWSPEARSSFEDYMRQIRPRLEAEGADPDEVSADLRRHIEQELLASGETSVTGGAIRRCLSRIGEPEPLGVQTLTTPAPEPPPAAAPPKSAPRILFGLIFGVFLPLVTIVIEASTHMCAETFFDPIPTWRHVAVVSLVPLTNLLLLLSIAGVVRPPARLAGIMSWISIGISGYYMLIFAPLSPIAVFMIVAWGWGLLPLAPLFAFYVAIRARVQFRNVFSPAPAKLGGLGWGLFAALALLISADLPAVVTRVAMNRAVHSPNEATRVRAINLLRAVGDRNTMHLACYGRTGSATSFWTGFFFTPVINEPARILFYRVTGLGHTSASDWGRINQRLIDDERFDIGLDIGGELVGPTIRNLSLAGSRIDGSLAADSALGYTEWTMEFFNNGGIDEEARAQIQLPHGGAVTRVTLWVNGEEREAVFAAKGKARAAYQQVAVRQRRDPVLVTTCGPDQVMMQCFPVQARGRMKVRLGITFPLQLESVDQAVMMFPRFIDRNFVIAEDFRHSAWIESRRPIQSKLAGLSAENPKPALYAVRGLVRDAALGGADAFARVSRDDVRQVWARDPVTTRSLVVQRIESEQPTPPRRVVLVIDGSASMRSAASGIADALAHFPEGIELTVLMASDAVATLQGPVTANKSSVEQVAAAIRNYNYAGGADNVPALLTAWDLASKTSGSIIIWFHGPQPIALSPVLPLAQCWERRPGGPKLLALSAAPGANRVVQQLDDRPEIEAVPAFGSAPESLRRLFDCWAGKATECAAVRERIDQTAGTPAGLEGSAHVARLWAIDEVRRLRQSAGVDDPAALELAARYKIVTPQTGAVVLETIAQYKQNDLEPPKAVGIPVVPEPGEWALIVVCVLMLVWAWKRRHACVRRA